MRRDVPPVVVTTTQLRGTLLDGAGRINYEAYRDAVGGTAMDGIDLPEWDGVPPRQRAGWMAGATAVRLDQVHQVDTEPRRRRLDLGSAAGFLAGGLLALAVIGAFAWAGHLGGCW